MLDNRRKLKTLRAMIEVLEEKVFGTDSDYTVFDVSALNAAYQLKERYEQRP